MAFQYFWDLHAGHKDDIGDTEGAMGTTQVWASSAFVTGKDYMHCVQVAVPSLVCQLQSDLLYDSIHSRQKVFPSRLADV